jgi:Response regulator containing a CheY-like receiver domain and an HTH DNA-binding domain
VCIIKGLKSHKIRLLLVDDHQVVRVGLRTLLNKDPTIHIVGEAATAADALSQAIRLKPDLVLMDVRLPDGTGIEACREIRSHCPRTRVLFLTSYADHDAVIATITAGADGYLLKEIDLEGLLRSIKSVMSGQSILDMSAAQQVHSWLASKSQDAKLSQLSCQEQKVLALIAEGLTNKEIGSSLGLSYKTIKNYVSNIFDKLEVSRRSQATALFLKHPSK